MGKENKHKHMVQTDRVSEWTEGGKKKIKKKQKKTKKTKRDISEVSSQGEEEELR